MDADYCAQIIKVIHTQGTPGFPSLMVYDKVNSNVVTLHDNAYSAPQLLGDHVKTVIFSCSEYEAKNYGTDLACRLA